MKKLLLVLSAVVVLVGQAWAEKVPDISLNALKSALADKSVTVIDVNGSASYAEGHIPTAIDYFANRQDLAAKLPSDKSALVVAYCYNPACGAYALAAEAAQKLGYTNVKHFVPGIEGWKAAGEPVAKAAN